MLAINSSRHAKKLLDEVIASMNKSVYEQWFRKNIPTNGQNIPKVIQHIIKQYSTTTNLSSKISFWHKYYYELDNKPW